MKKLKMLEINDIEVVYNGVIKAVRGVSLQVPDTITTVAGLSAHLAGGVVPQRGARLAEKGGSVIEVLDATPRSVRRVRFLFASHEGDIAA